MATVTLTWHSDIHDIDLATITVREMAPVSGQLGQLWWEVAVRHRDAFPAAAWTVMAPDWSKAVRVATGLALRTPDPELASALVLLVPDWDSPCLA